MSLGLRNLVDDSFAQIIGGDETSAGCGPGCVKNRHSGPCLRCGVGWEGHNGHICPFGGRGSWRVESSDSGKKISPLQLVKVLTDKESVKLVKGGQEPLPPIRVAVYSAHEHVREEDRQSFWEIGNVVTEDPKQLTSWVLNMPQWKSSSEDGEENDENDPLGVNLNDLPDAPPQMLKRESSAAETARLSVLRAELEETESATAVFADEEEAARKTFQQKAIAGHKELVLSVEERLTSLIRAADRINRIIEQRVEGGVLEALPKPIVSINAARDAALAIAWLESEETIKPVSFSRTEARKHVISIQNEIHSLKQMLLAAKVVAYVSSPLHKKLLNLCHAWLRTFLPHCLAKINRVSFGLLSSEHCKAALKADPHCPRSRLKLAVPFVGKDVPSKSSEFAHPDVTIGLTILAYR